MAISVECECGKTIKVKDELAGKKIKCPECQAVLTVPEEEEPVAEAREVEEDLPPARKVRDEEPDEADANDEPKRRGKKKKKGKQGSRTMFYVLLGGGALLLSLCCCGGGVGLFVYMNMAGDPEMEIVGKWQFDGDYGNHTTLGQPPPIMEFKQGGTFNLITNNPAIRYDNGKWKLVSKKGFNITVEVSHQLVHVHGAKDVTFPVTKETYDLAIPRHTVLLKRFRAGMEAGQRFKRIEG
jgi:hypothetical protein